MLEYFDTCLQGRIQYDEGRAAEAVQTFTEVIEQRPVPYVLKEALFFRAQCHEELGEPDAVVRDLTLLAAIGGIKLGRVARSLHNFGVRCNLRGREDLALKYFTAVAAIPDAAPGIRANALMNRGVHHGNRRRYRQANADFELALSIQGVPDRIRARTLFNLANSYRHLRRYGLAVRTFDEALANSAIELETEAAALAFRGICHCKMKAYSAAIADCRQARSIPGAPAETVAQSLLWEGISQEGSGNIDQALNAFSELRAMDDASLEMRARARWGVAGIRRKQGDREIALHELREVRQAFVEMKRNDLVRRVDREISAWQLADQGPDCTARDAISR